MAQPTQTNDTLTLYRLGMIEETLKAISENLERLATLEQKHFETRDQVTRAFDSIADHDTRIRSIETEMPTLKLTRKWVMSGVIGTLTLLGVTVFKLFTITLH
jgi:hypothetical protein